MCRRLVNQWHKRHRDNHFVTVLKVGSTGKNSDLVLQTWPGPMAKEVIHPREEVTTDTDTDNSISINTVF